MRTRCINTDKSEKNVNWEGKQVAKCSDAICAKFGIMDASGAQEKLGWGERNFHSAYNVWFLRKPSL